VYSDCEFPEYVGTWNTAGGQLAPPGNNTQLALFKNLDKYLKGAQVFSLSAPFHDFFFEVAHG
jgi:hypothetical protein